MQGRGAHLFRAHFFAREIESDADLLASCRHLGLNPVAAGLAPDPFAWRWSSVAATAGLAPAALALELDPLRAAFGERANWQARYRAFIESSGHTVSEPAASSPIRTKGPGSEALLSSGGRI